ncbi:MAG: HEPN domain-containing protein [Caldilineaceae bacterium]
METALIETHPLLEEAHTILDVTKGFDENIRRAHRLIIFATRGDLGNASPLETKGFIEDIMRSSIVLAHSSLETALRELIAHRLKAKADKEVPKIPLIGMQRSEKFHWKDLYPYRHKTVIEIINESIDDYVSYTSFNSTIDIANHLKELGVDLKYVKPLFADLDAMIQRRHQIVHESDYARASSEKKLETLTHIMALKWISNASTFLWYSVFSLLISDSYVEELNQKLREAGRPEIVITEESIKKLFDLSPKRENL